MLACGCAQEPPAATNTIAPAEPRPAPTSTAALAGRPVIATSGSPPPASAAAPGTALVSIEQGRVAMRELLPRGQIAFQIRNRTATAHEITLRGPSGTTAAPLPPNGSTVLQLLLGPGRHELLCTVSGHTERATFDTYVAGAPLNLPAGKSP